jgi:hypothetical protein
MLKTKLLLNWFYLFHNSELKNHPDFSYVVWILLSTSSYKNKNDNVKLIDCENHEIVHIHSLAAIKVFRVTKTHWFEGVYPSLCFFKKHLNNTYYVRMENLDDLKSKIITKGEAIKWKIFYIILPYQKRSLI